MRGNRFAAVAVAVVARGNGVMAQLCAAQGFDAATSHDHEPLFQDGMCKRQVEDVCGGGIRLAMRVVKLLRSQ